MPPKPLAINHRAALSLFHGEEMNIFKTKGEILECTTCEFINR